MNWTDEVEDDDDDAIIQTVFLKVDGLKKPLSLLTGWRTNSCKSKESFFFFVFAVLLSLSLLGRASSGSISKLQSNIVMTFGSLPVFHGVVALLASVIPLDTSCWLMRPVVWCAPPTISYILIRLTLVNDRFGFWNPALPRQQRQRVHRRPGHGPCAPFVFGVYPPFWFRENVRGAAGGACATP